MVNLCGRRVKTCGSCGHRYSKDEYELWECPECKAPRGCKQKVKKEGEACRLHGGASLRGPSSPSFKHGGYSKYMPKPLLEKFQEFTTDEARLTVVEEINLARAILAGQVEEYGQLGGQEIYSRALNQLSLVHKALNAKEPDIGRVRTALLGMEDTLREGIDKEGQLVSINRTLDTIRKLNNTERGIYQAKGEFITRQFMFFVIDLLVGGLEQYVKPLSGGPEALIQLTRLISNLLSGVYDREAQPGIWRAGPALISPDTSD